MLTKKLLALAGFIALFSWNQQVHAQDFEQWDIKVAETNTDALPYAPYKIIVRGFDGKNPPPRLTAPQRQLFYGYGMTAYYQTKDTLTFFTLLYLDAVHYDKDANVVASFPQAGSRYSDEFKNYFVNRISEAERKNIRFENIYLKDKKGNYLKITTPQEFCPHCL